MIFTKFNKKLILIILFSIQVNICGYLPSGIRSLNKFLYFSRVKKYYNQSKIKTCSFSDGPNCYFVENDYIKHYILTHNENKSEINNHGWVRLYSKIPKNQYFQILNNLYINTANYINTYSKLTDKEQNPQDEISDVLMTFDMFDSQTIEKDIILGDKSGEIFFNEKIIADLNGKLKLSYDKDLTEKYLNMKYKDYPSTTFGIIESDSLSISFRKKLFVCNFIYIKPHEKSKESEKILFYGYIKEQLVYTYGYIDNQQRKEKWLKVVFPEKIAVDKISISGPYDIDNLSFSFPRLVEYDNNEIYNNYNYKNIKSLINNDDI
jgi:hypothetical protein